MLVAPKYSDYTYEPKITVQEGKRQTRKTKKRFSVKLKYGIVGLIVLAFAIGLAFTSRVAVYFYKGYEITKLNREIEALQTDNERLKLEIEQLCSLDRVEDLAVNQLGMVKPDAEDIEFLPVDDGLALAFENTGDKDNDDSLIAAEDEETSSFLAVWTNKLSSLFVNIVEASELDL